MNELPKQYEPQAAQSRWISFWQEHGYFNANPNPDKPSHTIMIPLPNVTGALHMGHALNGTCQDLINRWRRMQGYEALWMPGTDHAGIATQAVVERRMFEEEGLTRHTLAATPEKSREALVNRIWKWKDVYEKRILDQLKEIGSSCDWRRTRFTLDDQCSKAVRRTFFKMFEDGLIYRGKRLVNWDLHLQTAVANDEVFEEEIDGHFWTFNYPVVDDAGNDTEDIIRFATTRPETMLGDTAVCVHPKDERYAALIGKKVKIPLNGRLIPIIADGQLADMEKGTGAVKVTPGHDHNDFACYQRNPEIGIIDLFNFDGTLNEHGGDWAGQDRLEVRNALVERMAELGHYEGVEDRRIPMKHSDRSKTPVETLRSDQWFVRMGEFENGNGKKFDLAQSAIDAAEDDRVKFFPARYKKTYVDWLSEKRDWCISRQLWWGHRIPVWTLPEEVGISLDRSFWARLHTLSEWISEGRVAAFNDGSPITVTEDGVNIGGDSSEDGGDFSICVRDPEDSFIVELLEAAGFVQDPDVLDTWFSSALWPHATLGWPDENQNPPLNAEEVAKQTALEQNGELSGSSNEVLPYFYPGSVLITSRDIITLWVARMVLAGLYNMDDVPFQHVHVHPKILDGFGQTMSKSRGNGVDPLDLIGKYGTDAIRFTIASFAGETQDVRLPIGYECPHCEETIPQKLYPTDTITYVVPKTLQGKFPVGKDGKKPELKCPGCKKNSQFSTPAYDPDSNEPLARTVSERFEYGRNFCNKLWNAARFAMLNLDDFTPGAINFDELPLEDRWILSRLSTVSQQLNESLSRYQFDAATRAIRDFTWNEFCDWYLEMIKSRLRDETTKPVAQRVLVGVLDNLVRMLQPFTPFICEELWSRLGELAPQRGLPEPTAAEDAAIIAKWPEIPGDWQDSTLEKRFELLQETIVAVRNVRTDNNIPPGTKLPLHVRCSAEVAEDLQNVALQFDNLAKVEIVATGPDVTRPAASASFSLGDADGYIPLEGVIDRDA
jgi:valyl-tRNA synthetase